MRHDQRDRVAVERTWRGHVFRLADDDAVGIGKARGIRVRRAVVDERHVPAELLREPHDRHRIVPGAEDDERRRRLDALDEDVGGAVRRART